MKDGGLFGTHEIAWFNGGLFSSDAAIALEREEIEILAVGTPFENSPVVVVSALSGAGIDELRAVIAATLADIEPKPEVGLLRIPVDRVFVMKGHGVVVTGTRSGSGK